MSEDAKLLITFMVCATLVICTMIVAGAVGSSCQECQPVEVTDE